MTDDSIIPADEEPADKGPADKERRVEVLPGAEDVLVRLLSIEQKNYESIRVNSSWAEKGLLEGDIVLCARGLDAGEGDIILIQQEGRERLGIMATPGFLETPRGNRMLEATEEIVGVGVALARRLRPRP
ncbi:MAG TPA: hypothetical protein VKM94_21665 [Blastocatellia bacterium]|nr:hypothetical protein [Blastocatellia bacterium]